MSNNGSKGVGSTVSNKMENIVSIDEKYYVPPPPERTPIIDDNDDDITYNNDNNIERTCDNDINRDTTTNGNDTNNVINSNDSNDTNDDDDVPHWRLKRPIMIMSDEYANILDSIKADDNKYGYFWELCKAYNIHNKQSNLKIIKHMECGKDDLLKFHTNDYVDILEDCENYDDYMNCSDDEKELINTYGLMDDNYIFPGLYKYCKSIVGANLQCSYIIKNELSRVVINFGGGRHHAKDNKANGQVIIYLYILLYMSYIFGNINIYINII